MIQNEQKNNPSPTPQARATMKAGSGLLYKLGAVVATPLFSGNAADRTGRVAGNLISLTAAGAWVLFGLSAHLAVSTAFVGFMVANLQAKEIPRD